MILTFDMTQTIQLKFVGQVFLEKELEWMFYFQLPLVVKHSNSRSSAAEVKNLLQKAMMIVAAIAIHIQIMVKIAFNFMARILRNHLSQNVLKKRKIHSSSFLFLYLVDRRFFPSLSLSLSLSSSMRSLNWTRITRYNGKTPENCCNISSSSLCAREAATYFKAQINTKTVFCVKKLLV